MMFVVDTNAATVRFDVGKSKGEENTGTLFYIAKKEDLTELSTPDLIDIFNAIAKSDPELGIREVSRFSTREVGENRTWGLFVRLKALEAEKGEKTVEEPSVPPPAAKKAPSRPKAAREPKPKAEMKAPKAPPTNIVKKAGKVFPPKPGTAKARALELISAKDGIDIDEWVAEMNKTRRKGSWKRSTAWSGLVYLLHQLHGYGIKRENNRFYLLP